MAAGRIASVAEFKEALHITGSTDDTVIGKHLDRASQWIEDWTGRTFVEQTGIVEYHDVEFYEREIFLRQFPITTTTATDVREDTVVPPVYGADTLLTENTDYVVRKDIGSIELLQGLTFTPHYPNSIKVTYSAGYATVPESVKQACILLAGYWWQKLSDKSALFVLSKSVGEGSTQIDPDGIPKAVKDILEIYKTRHFGATR